MDDVKPSRRAKSAATRKKILDAAQAEFTAKGFHGATMASIAASAGVAAPTVYFVFHTKAAIISALIDTLVIGEDEPVIPQESAWWRAMLAEPDPRESLRHFVQGTGPLFQRASLISEILRSAALTDEEVQATYAFHEGLRLEGFREVVETVAAKGLLRPGLTLDEAVDILLSVFSDTMYYVMTVERGWSHERFIAWMCEALPTLLLEGS